MEAIEGEGEAERRCAEGGEAASAGEVRSGLEQHVAAKTPSNETRLLEAELSHHRYQDPREPREAIDRFVSATGSAMAREVDRMEEKVMTQRTVHLPREGARG
jgi:hypothetical protein